MMNQPIVQTFPDAPALHAALHDLLLDALTRESHGDYAVILSGGNTPLPVYARLAQTGGIASPHLHLTLSDERHVPATDPQNNAFHLRPVANAFQLPPNRFLAVNTALPLHAAARDFDTRLGDWMQRGIVFELAVLGIGPDGHTASLFSPDDVARGSDALAIPVNRPTPPDRISLTPRIFSITRRVILLAAGTEKAPIIQTLLHTPLAIPCGLALQHVPHLELWTDSVSALKHLK